MLAAYSHSSQVPTANEYYIQKVKKSEFFSWYKKRDFKYKETLFNS